MILRIRRRWFWSLLLLAGLFWFLPTLGRFLYPLPYSQIIFSVARQSRLDPLLVAAVIRVESKFYPWAKSERGALGLMQLMPETARWVAEMQGLKYEGEKLMEPEYNLKLGCWYLAHLRDEFGGDLVPALAAYNGGRGRIRTWLNEGIWDGSLDTLDRIPYAETREFVKRVIYDYRIYRLLYPHLNEYFR
ncbi:MAG: soluble lytic murein transglycosylase [Clostridia bacterium]|nr:soluble lytic murein transglycosylase [Clostridia bacterium]